MKRANMDIREEAKKNGVFFWEIAARMGVSDPTFTRLMRFELPAAKKENIFSIIRDISSNREEEDA